MSLIEIMEEEGVEEKYLSLTRYMLKQGFSEWYVASLFYRVFEDEQEGTR